MKDGIIFMDVEDGLIWQEIHQMIKFIYVYKMGENL